MIDRCVCGEDVIVTRHRVLDAVGTPDGPFTRHGLPRGPEQKAIARRYERPEGHAPHFCTNLPGARP